MVVPVALFVFFTISQVYETVGLLSIYDATEAANCNVRLLSFGHAGYQTALWEFDRDTSTIETSPVVCTATMQHNMSLSIMLVLGCIACSVYILGFIRMCSNLCGVLPDNSTTIESAQEHGEDPIYESHAVDAENIEGYDWFSSWMYSSEPVVFFVFVLFSILGMYFPYNHVLQACVIGAACALHVWRRQSLDKATWYMLPGIAPLMGGILALRVGAVVDTFSSVLNPGELQSERLAMQALVMFVCAPAIAWYPVPENTNHDIRAPFEKIDRGLLLGVAAVVFGTGLMSPVIHDTNSVVIAVLLLVGTCTVVICSMLIKSS